MPAPLAIAVAADAGHGVRQLLVVEAREALRKTDNRRAGVGLSSCRGGARGRGCVHVTAADHAVESTAPSASRRDAGGAVDADEPTGCRGRLATFDWAAGLAGALLWTSSRAAGCLPFCEVPDAGLIGGRCGHRCSPRPWLSPKRQIPNLPSLFAPAAPPAKATTAAASRRGN